MLNVALEQHLEMVPYFAIGAFCGLRVHTALRKLLWSDIRLDEPVEIGKQTAKGFVIVCQRSVKTGH